MELIYTNEDIAVIGAGIVTPAGIGLEEFNEALKLGSRHISQLKNIQVPHNKRSIGQLNTTIFDLPNKACMMALYAVKESLTKNNIDMSKCDETALFVATIGGDSKAAEDSYSHLDNIALSKRKLRRLLALYPNNNITRFLAKNLQIENNGLVVSNACASGNIALGLAIDALRMKQCKIAIVVGVENCKLSMIWGAERSGFIGRILRPFDEDRDGTILGEGAAAVILTLACDVGDKETYGYLQGFGCVCDKGATAITLAADGDGLYRSMKLALREAGKEPEQVEYVNAHAPGTPMIDLIECNAIINVGIPSLTAVNATKSITTHLSGASPIAELIATLLQMRDGYVHPNVGHTKIDKKLPITPVGRITIDRKISFGLSNACGGGGLNTSVAISSVLNTNKKQIRKVHSRFAVTGVGWISEDTVNWRDLNESNIFTKTTPSTFMPINIYDYFPKETKYHFLNKAAQICAVAGSLTIESAFKGQGFFPYNNDDIAVIAGTYLGGSPEASLAICEKLATNPESITPNTALDHGVHLGATLICRHYGLLGTAYTITGGKCAGLQALSVAVGAMVSQRSKAALITGFDGSCEFQSRLLQRIQSSKQQPVRYTSAGGGIFIEEENDINAKGRIPVAYIHHPITAGTKKYINRKDVLKKLLDKTGNWRWSNIYLGCDYSSELVEFVEEIEMIVKYNPRIYYLPDNSYKLLAAASFFAISASVKQLLPSLIISSDTRGSFHAAFVEPYIKK